MTVKYKSKKTKSKKKIYKKKNVKSIINRNMVNLGQGFPKKMLMTHKYVETFTFTAPAGTAVFHRFWCNGMYDPNYTSTGHQPYLYDQACLLYNHYTVIGSKIKVKSLPVNNVQPAYKLSLSQNDDTTQTNNSVEGTAEQSNAQTLLVGPGNSTDSVKQFSSKWSAKKAFGGSVLGNDNLQGTSGTNPTEAMFFVIGLQSLDLVTQIQVYIDVEIEYIAIWEELKDLTQS